MKKLILFCLSLVTTAMLFSQSPDMFNYQAVVRDAAGAVKANQNVNFRTSILEGSASGTAVLQETHPVSTNEFGLVNLEIGNGYPVSGNIASINWGSSTYYLKVELDPAGGTSFINMGTSQLLSVPYALHAKTVQIDQVNDADADPANEIQEIQLSGTVLTLSKGGGSVTLPSTGGGDNWGTQVVLTDITLTGSGTAASPLKIADNGVTSSKIQDGTIATIDLADDAVTNAKIINTAVSTDKLANNAVTAPKLASMGASAWQVLKWNGTNWSPAKDSVDDADNNPANEIQELQLSGTQLTLSKGGGTVTLPSTGGGDNWGTQTVLADATLAGNGTTATPLKIADNGVNSSKIQDGSIVTADLADHSVTTLKITDGSIATADLANSTVTTEKLGNLAVSSEKIQNGAVTGAKIAQAGATSGQVLKWNVSSTTWLPANDETGGLTLPFNSLVNTNLEAFRVENTGSGNGISGLTSAANTAGVYGCAGASTGFSMGVSGISRSPKGIGVIGTCSDNVGVQGQGKIGIQGSSSEPDGYSGYFSGNAPFFISGRTGIGILSPETKLHIKGDGTPNTFVYIQSFFNGQNAGIRLYEGTTGRWSIFNVGGDGNFQIYNGSEKTAIYCTQASSYVGIGTTHPSCQLQVGSTGDGSQARANAWNILSDARLKKNFTVLSNPLEMVQHINGYYFYWNTGTDDTRQVGFSAQEVQKIIPEVVSDGEDGYLSIEYGKMTPLLVEAIKAQQGQIRELRAENDQLKERLGKIERLLSAHTRK